MLGSILRLGWPLANFPPLGETSAAGVLDPRWRHPRVAVGVVEEFGPFYRDALKWILLMRLLGTAIVASLNSYAFLLNNRFALYPIGKLITFDSPQEFYLSLEELTPN